MISLLLEKLMTSIIEQEMSRLQQAKESAKFHTKAIGSGVGMLGVGALAHKVAKKINPEWVAKQRNGTRTLAKSVSEKLKGEEL